VFRQAIEASAPELAKLMPELHRLFPDMEPPLELPPQLRQRFLFTNVRDFFARSSRFMPLAIFIDDIQWADQSTLQLTQQLAQQIGGFPIMIIAAYGEIEANPTHATKGRLHHLLDRVRGQAHETLTPQAIKTQLDQLISRRDASAIVLRPFTLAEVQSVLAALGQPNPPARLVRKFADHTGGNPFFVTELFRHLKEEGRLFDARHQWTRDVDLEAVELPDTVRVVLEHRMQRVSQETQSVLRAASVIGREFEPDLLEEVADIDGEALISALDEAEAARILKGPSGRRDITWRFAHPLTCPTLTAAIPPLRRQRLHLRAANAMTRLDQKSRVYTSGIAHHLYCAGRLADPVITAGALMNAGESARAVYATEEALQHYRRALDVLQDTNADKGVVLSVRETLADLLGLVGDRAEALALYDTVASAYGPAHATVDRARIARKAGTLHWQAGDRGEAMAAYRRALDELSGSAAHIEAAHLYQELGLAAFRSGDNDKAVEWAERALLAAEKALAEPASDAPHVRKAATTAIAQATNTIGVALARSGQLDAARERIERSLAAAQDLGLLEVVCRAYANLGVLYSSVEPKRAIDVSLTGLEIASRIGAVSLQSYIYANLAAAYCALTDGCETDGLQAAEASAARDRELGQLDHLAVPLVVMAQIHQCRGELQTAYDVYHEALALAEKIGEPQLILPCYDGLATIHLDRGDRIQAQAFMEKGRQLCDRTGLDPDTLLLLPFLC
jgi:adenylate cyclase